METPEGLPLCDQVDLVLAARAKLGGTSLEQGSATARIFNFLREGAYLLVPRSDDALSLEKIEQILYVQYLLRVEGPSCVSSVAHEYVLQHIKRVLDEEGSSNPSAMSPTDIRDRLIRKRVLTEADRWTLENRTIVRMKQLLLAQPSHRGGRPKRRFGLPEGPHRSLSEIFELGASDFFRPSVGEDVLELTIQAFRRDIEREEALSGRVSLRPGRGRDSRGRARTPRK
ncbi:MAG: hypothetical protein HY390_03525 [Deltaproteobacteria bacterium]|nr:hypothetical protein [Deltaproteobacteria bacterium]